MKTTIIFLINLFLLLFNNNNYGQQPIMLKDINPGEFSGIAGRFFVANNNVLFFDAGSIATGAELWKSDGTVNGTVIVKDIIPGNGHSINSNHTPASSNGILYFSADNGFNGIELWKSDGSANNTVMVKDINAFSYFHSDPRGFTNANGIMFFNATDGINGFELWKSDGTLSGTKMVKDIYSSSPANNDFSSDPTQLTNVNETLFFGAVEPVHGYELWKSDGSVTGTVMVKNINSNNSVLSGNSGLRFLTNVNGTLFFAADNGINGFELWKSDGSEAGTVMVKEIFPGNSMQFGYSSFINNITNVNGIIFFSACGSLNNSELWKSDGTAAGTVKVKEINATTGSSPSNLTNINGILYFSANDGINGIEPWKSDGTESGTMMVKNLNPGAMNSDPTSFVNINGTAYFTANDGNGPELFKTDGTAIGTTDFNLSTPTSGGIANLINLNGILIFAHVTQLYGRELWGLDTNSLSNSDNKINDNKFSIFPNPANNMLTIYNLENKSIDKIEILDLTGKKVLEQKNNSNTINVENLQNGMYLLQIISDGKNSVSKFIKN